jgi:hypothetical protein
MLRGYAILFFWNIVFVRDFLEKFGYESLVMKIRYVGTTWFLGKVKKFSLHSLALRDFKTEACVSVVACVHETVLFECLLS